MKSIIIFITTILVGKFCLADSRAKLFHVYLETEKGGRLISVSAPKDYMALTSVLVGAIYTKVRIGKILNVTIKETGLSINDLPLEEFLVTTDIKEYKLYLNIVDPEYAMIAIQASKYLMSRTSAREVIHFNEAKRLKSMPVVKYKVRFSSEEISYLMNTTDREKALIALDIAARMSKKASKYIETIDSSSVAMGCRGLFSRR